jgi:ankyrin repeat protein
MAHLLLNRGADIAHVTPKGHTVLDFAALIQCQDIMKAYIKAQVWELRRRTSRLRCKKLWFLLS